MALTIADAGESGTVQMLSTHKLSAVCSVLLAAGCSASPDAPGDDQDGDDDGDGSNVLPRLKADLVGLIEGDYSQHCVKFIDDELQPVGSGSPVSFSGASGVADWGFGSINMVATPSQDFGVLVGDGEASGRFDLLDPVSQDRLAIIGVTIDRDGFGVATITDDRPSPSLGDGCSAATTPALASADLWQLMNDYIHVPTTKLHCINLSTAAQFDWDFAFDGNAITLDAFVTHPGDARHSEMVQLSEYEPQRGFSYTLSRADDQTISVYMTPARALSTVQWITADTTIIGCNPP